MRRLFRGLLPGLGLVSVTALAADASAPVVSAGPEKADFAAVARAFGRVPAFQLAALAADDNARRHAVVERRLVPELPQASGAAAHTEAVRILAPPFCFAS